MLIDAYNSYDYIKSLGINTDKKQIYYQRHKNNTSMLAIKLNDESNEDEKNYLICVQFYYSIHLGSR